MSKLLVYKLNCLKLFNINLHIAKYSVIISSFKPSDEIYPSTQVTHLV